MEVLHDIPTNIINEIYIRAVKNNRTGYPLSPENLLIAYDQYLEAQAAEEERRERERAKSEEQEKLRQMYAWARARRVELGLEDAQCDCVDKDGTRYRARTRVWNYRSGWAAELECGREYCQCRFTCSLGKSMPD
jgi:hypothetical protein